MEGELPQMLSTPAPPTTFAATTHHKAMFHDIVCEEDLANVAAIMDTNVEVSGKATHDESTTPKSKIYSLVSWFSR